MEHKTRFSKTSLSSLDLNNSRTSFTSESETVVSPLESIKSQYDECHALLTKANEQIEYYKLQLAQESEKKKQLERTSKDEAAALWFQCETLKTQFAQIEAKFKRANADIDSYKQQLKEKQEQETDVRQLAELVIKQESLIEEYESSMDASSDIRQELVALKNQKQVMENTIDSLRADLEMSHGQMRLMLTVSTEIQDEFENFKQAKENEIQEILAQQQQPTTNTYYEHQIEQLKQALVAKDRVIADIQNQLRTQRMSMDAQMMELTETILEKDALLMEFMSSRNNSREIVQHQQPELSRLVTTTTVAPANITNSFYHPHDDEDTPRIQMSQVREYLYSESDSEDDQDESEVIVLSYSSDDEPQPYAYNNSQQQPVSDPNSPTSSIASFDSSSSSEEKIAEIKHFSYSSAQTSEDRLSHIKENWPMPPPTPPPSEPLPPVPPQQLPPPPRRGRSRTMVRDEIELPKIQEVAPVPPPRKAHLKLEKHRTSWMDDPEDNVWHNN